MAYYKSIVTGIILLLSVLFGWKLNTWYTGYKLSESQKIEKIVEDGIRTIESKQAQVLNDKLNELLSQDWKVNTITNKPIYMNQCIDEEGLKQLQENKDKVNALRKKSP